jgi:hypothetical protein
MACGPALQLHRKPQEKVASSVSEAPGVLAEPVPITPQLFRGRRLRDPARLAWVEVST